MTHALRELLTATLLAAQTIYQPTAGQPGKDVVWVPTPPEVVEKMLDVAKVTPQDFVIDLGSGDGRNIIAAAKRGARALGVEYNHDLVELSRQRAKDAGVADKAMFVQGDMYKADISKATVLALFLTPEVLDQMRDKFLAMKPGTRIVVNTFPVTDWEPDVTEVTPAPCKVWCTTMLMIVPAQVAGTWQLGNSQMTLRQDFQFVRGKMGNEDVTGRLRGDEITLRVGSAEYAGRVTADHIDGTVTIDGKTSNWQASRLAR
jgi:precorrin-6B methylase 2